MASAAAPKAPTFYRTTPVGMALAETLQTLVGEGSLKRVAVTRILDSFDKCFPAIMTDADKLLSKDRKRKRQATTVVLSGKLSNYNNLFEYWRIDLDDASLKIGEDAQHVDHARLLLFTTPTPGKRGKK